MSKEEEKMESGQDQENAQKEVQDEQVISNEEFEQSADVEENTQNSCEDELETLKAKVAELEDKYLRANADFDNMKKRLEREKSQAVNYANELFARDMLAVIDALDSASLLEENTDLKPEELFKKIKEGIDLTVEQCKKSFEKHGIELIKTDSQFDPNFHEAVMQVDSEEKEKGQIVQVFQKGYKIKDRVLRPAMVSIVK